jgi:hypothetical protein
MKKLRKLTAQTVAIVHNPGANGGFPRCWPVNRWLPAVWKRGSKETGMRKLVLRIAAAVTVVVLGASGASASTISFSFTGHVTYVDNGSLGPSNADLSGQFSVGDLLTGTLIFDDGATLDSVMRYERGAVYISALQSLSGSIGAYTVSGNNVTQISPRQDSFHAIEGLVPNTTISGAAVNGYALDSFSLGFDGPSTALVPPVFSNYANPPTFALDFGGIIVPRGPNGPGIAASPTNPYGAVYGGLDSFAPTEADPVPEPSSILLLGTGIIGAGVRRWRRRKSTPSTITKRRPSGDKS